MRIEYETRGLIRFREMRIHFGIILSVLMKQRINENMVWTDSQDYGVDEILYTIGTVLFNINNRLMREIIILFEVYPQLFLFLEAAKTKTKHQIAVSLLKTKDAISK